MDKFLGPAIVSAIITGLLAPLIFYLLKRRDDEKRRNFDVRYAEYKHYLKTLDEITAAVRLDTETFFTNTITETYGTIINNPEGSNDALLKMHQSLMSMINNIQKTVTRAEGELHGLKLVCSGKLFEMVNEYVQLQRDLLDATSRMMDNWKKIDINNPTSFFTGELQEKGKRAQNLYQDIIMQMRIELRIK